MYGFVCFAYSKNKWYDHFLAKLMGSKWSHSFFTSCPILGFEMAMECDAYGTSIASFDIEYRNNFNQSYEVYKFNVSQDVIDCSIKNRIKELKISYGYLEYFWFAWRFINYLFGRDIKQCDNWCQNGTKICSQFLREFIEDCGYKNLFIGYGKGSITPQDIYQIVLSNPKLFELIEKK